MLDVQTQESQHLVISLLWLEEQSHAKESIIATVEAKFVACFEATFHALWLQNFISRLNVVESIARSLRIYCDNSIIVSFSKSDKYFKGAKHMDLKYLSLKKELQKQSVN